MNIPDGYFSGTLTFDEDEGGVYVFLKVREGNVQTHQGIMVDVEKHRVRNLTPLSTKLYCQHFSEDAAKELEELRKESRP